MQKWNIPNVTTVFKLTVLKANQAPWHSLNASRILSPFFCRATTESLDENYTFFSFFLLSTYCTSQGIYTAEARNVRDHHNIHAKFQGIFYRFHFCWSNQAFSPSGVLPSDSVMSCYVIDDQPFILPQRVPGREHINNGNPGSLGVTHMRLYIYKKFL